MVFSMSRGLRANDLEERQHIVTELQLIEELEQADEEEEMELAWDALDYAQRVQKEYELDVAEEPLSCYGDWEDW